MKYGFLFILSLFVVSICNAQTATPVFTLNENELVLPSPITFEAGTATLKSESDAALLHIKSYLEAKSYISLIRIEGHVSNGKNSEENDKLSSDRAMVVAKWLKNHGVDCSRLLASGFADTKPITENNTPEGKAANTRITIVNAELRGKAIGGMPVDGGGFVPGDACR